jgi:hypothetical protein
LNDGSYGVPDKKVIARTIRAAGGFLAVTVLACAAPPPTTPQAPRAFAGIDTTVIREMTRVLAHDSMGGRGTGAPGSAAAARIIAQACREAGLEPVAGSYRHPVPLTRTAILPSTSLAIHGGAGSQPLTFAAGEDFVIRPASIVRPFVGDAVYVGTETSLREGDALPQLAGQVAVTLGTISPAMADRVAAVGAQALVSLLPDTAHYGQLRRTAERPMWALQDTSVHTAHVYALPTVVLGREAATVLADAARPDGPSWPRFDRTIEVRLDADRAPVVEHNIACVLAGDDGASADTALVYTAHYDHLGVRSANAGDSIFNGFSDNAAGVAMLLATARAMRAARRPPPNTVLFLFLAAEEVGLLGAEYFVHHPPWPLSRIKAVINLDAGAPPAKPWTWRIAGGDSSALGELAMDVAARNGWSAVTSAATPNSDYYPFWDSGVPAIFIIPGPAKYEGISADSSDALRARWDRYHQAGDEWHEDFPFEGLGRYAEYALRVGLATMQ